MGSGQDDRVTRGSLEWLDSVEFDRAYHELETLLRPLEAAGLSDEALDVVMGEFLARAEHVAAGT